MELSVINQKLAMDSRDIAKLTHKQHKNVIRDIENMLSKNIGSKLSRLEYVDSRGRKQPYYCLPHRELLILLTGYSVELRAAVIDRWAYLERRYKKDRVQSIEVRKEFTDELKDRGYVKQYQYIQTTKQMKNILDIKNIKKSMTRQELKEVTASEAMARLMLTDEYGYYEVNPVCVRAAKLVKDVATKRIPA